MPEKRQAYPDTIRRSRRQEEGISEVKVAIVALLGVLLMSGVAAAHKLPVGEAKSLHRVDCVSKVTNGEGGKCAWVSIARIPANSYEIRVHHKRIFC